jgi:hypothetical protein
LADRMGERRGELTVGYVAQARDEIKGKYRQ